MNRCADDFALRARACLQLSRIVIAASCTPARKFLASLSVAISLVRTCAPYLDPDMPLVEALLARAQGPDIRLTMVDGRILYRDGRLTGLDIADIEQAAAGAARQARLPADAASRERARQLDPHLRRHYRAVSGSPP